MKLFRRWKKLNQRLYWSKKKRLRKKVDGAWEAYCKITARCVAKGGIPF